MTEPQTARLLREPYAGELDALYGDAEAMRRPTRLRTRLWLLLAAAALFTVLLDAVGCGGGTHAAKSSDPPTLVPWRQIGNIALGEARARVEHDYGSLGYHVIQRYGSTVQGYYRLHGRRVIVTYYGPRVGELDFDTPYYRTPAGLGVGSRIPLGACHRTASNPCEHRWHGFVWNLRLRENPCSCWTKVGSGARSLPATAANFGRPWFIIVVRRGRISRFSWALKYVD